MAVAIKVEHLSKAYELGVIGTGTLSRDLHRWVAKARGKEDPFLRIGEVNDRTISGGSNVVWSLRDINLEINQGDAVGVIGRNGAGKSTLLKLLSRVTSPTSGTIKFRGRIASLLEVGTGFHPELTGKENIYLNGAILGMSRKEITRKLDEIIDFSGVGKYINTPVKRYSSGMYVRLAFAVAANLESEILIVDEVLAVGDAEFQKKCLGKVKEVATGGRTVLFVSHNMAAIQQLCTSVVCLKNGMVEFQGDVEKGMQVYFNTMRAGREMQEEMFQKRKNGKKKAYISGFDVQFIEEDQKLLISVAVDAPEGVERAEMALGVNDSLGLRIITLHTRFTGEYFDLEPGLNRMVCSVDNFFLRPGAYSMDISLFGQYDFLDWLENPLEFEIPEYSFYPSAIRPEGGQGALMASYSWGAYADSQNKTLENK